MRPIFILFFLFSINIIHAQVTISGQVIEENQEYAIPYATVKAIDNQDPTNIQGSLTDENGAFSFTIQAEDFIVEVSYIGYEDLVISEFSIDNGAVVLGTIPLNQDTALLQEVVVEEERSRTTFELDKRVFQVGSDLSSSGASALEVLNNVPSVTVDIEGQVNLRGSGGVQILIDGKPSVLATDESNALGTITADMIEKVEVITNPSAKYEAEGTSGIINIVMKKNEKTGLNGSVTLNTGAPDNHSLGLSINKRANRFNLFSQLGIGYRSLPRNNESINEDLTGGSIVQSLGEEFRNENFYNFILGSDYYFNENSVLTISGNYAFEDEQQPSEFEFEQWVNGTLENEWTREEETEADNPKYQYEVNYKRDFEEEDHNLILSAIGSFFGKEQQSQFQENAIIGEVVNELQQTQTAFDESRYTFKADYQKPINDKFSIETGSQYFLNSVGNDFQVENFTNGVWVSDPTQTNDFEFEQNVLGAYATGSYEGEKWGIKAGLRVENTDMGTSLINTGEENNRNYTDFFPSAHTSYAFSDQLQLQAGYSRRIFRPRLWNLNPFFNIRNNFSIRTGNPNLQPEYTDSYEITAINEISSDLILSYSIFHRYTTDVVERITTFDDNVAISSPENIGTNNTTGFEVTGEIRPASWITLNTDANFNLFTRRGTFDDQSFDFTGEQLNGRLVSRMKLPKDFDVELTGNYNSGFQTVQSQVSDNIFLDFGVRKKFMKGKGILNASVRDMFTSRFRESVIQNPAVFQYNFGQRGRFLTLGFSYGFGKGEAMTYSGRRR